ncbi:MAG: hypothetical protein C4538_06630 [Nitrospiraceae bacterium]|nr:MAG: hypothetical protein C4538_06630 [Nitrospiraceae bacterium]
MKHRYLILFLVITGIAALVYALSGEPHRFSQSECTLCHTTEKPGNSDITMEVTVACETCHPDYPKTQSHPTDIYPDISVPGDMPLNEGRLTCLTCHYAHIEHVKQQNKEHYFLRRPVQGVIFCSACHQINEKRHIVFQNIHKGQYEVTDRNTRIDRMSLECIQCHDKYIAEPLDSLGAGRWKHFKKEFNHPIGASYRDISSRKMNKFRPEHMLNEKIKLYDGKMGCGTCHNIYSKERAMLIMDNRGSRLCLECHSK